MDTRIPSVSRIALNRFLSVLARYCSMRRRLDTIVTRPRVLLWSLGLALAWVVRYSMRADQVAIWYSGLPVSLSASRDLARAASIAAAALKAPVASSSSTVVASGGGRPPASVIRTEAAVGRTAAGTVVAVGLDDVTAARELVQVVAPTAAAATKAMVGRAVREDGNAREEGESAHEKTEEVFG